MPYRIIFNLSNIAVLYQWSLLVPTECLAGILSIWYWRGLSSAI